MTTWIYLMIHPCSFHFSGDQIKTLRLQDPVASALDSLASALEKQDFKTATSARDDLAIKMTQRARDYAPPTVNRICELKAFCGL
jgi:hypothetical protein